MSDRIRCPNCEGSGSDNVITPYVSIFRACGKCKGVGEIAKPLPLPRKVSVLEEEYERLKADCERLDKLEIRRLEEENEKLKSDLAQWHDLYEEHNERR